MSLIAFSVPRGDASNTNSREDSETQWRGHPPRPPANSSPAVDSATDWRRLCSICRGTLYASKTSSRIVVGHDAEKRWRLTVCPSARTKNSNISHNRYNGFQHLAQCTNSVFSSSVTYPAMGIGPLLLECHGAIDNLTMSPRFVESFWWWGRTDRHFGPSIQSFS